MFKKIKDKTKKLKYIPYGIRLLARTKETAFMGRGMFFFSSPLYIPEYYNHLL
jgi:hypothetical protein